MHRHTGLWDLEPEWVLGKGESLVRKRWGATTATAYRLSILHLQSFPID